MVEKEILLFLMREVNILVDEFLEFKFIVNEFLINVVVYGNKEDSLKFVKVKVGIVDRKFSYIVVEDEGEGFDIDRVFKEYILYDEKDEIEDLYEFG